MKVFKTLKSAMNAAAGHPVVRVGGSKKIYIVVEDDLVGIGLCEVEVISSSGVITGQVSLRHLDRLGNANRAIAASSTAAGVQTSFFNKIEKTDANVRANAERAVHTGGKWFIDGVDVTDEVARLLGMEILRENISTSGQNILQRRAPRSAA